MKYLAILALAALTTQVEARPAASRVAEPRVIRVCANAGAELLSIESNRGHVHLTGGHICHKDEPANAVLKVSPTVCEIDPGDIPNTIVLIQSCS